MSRPTIRTPRLLLIAADAPLARAAADGPRPLAGALGADVPPSWPPPDLADALEFFAAHLESNPAGAWSMWFVLVDAPPPGRPLLVGGAGFKGPPRDDGTVEVGYAIVDDQHRRGYATEAVGGLIRFAFGTPGVSRVTAHTFELHEASVGVLRKHGFVCAGPGVEPVDERDRRGRGELLLFELRRDDWARAEAGRAGPQRSEPVRP